MANQLVDANWVRWTQASFNDFWNQNKGSYHLFIEAADRDTSQFSEFAELRIDGPFVHQMGANWFELFVEVNTLFTVIKDDRDLYRMQRIQGHFLQNCYVPSVPCFRFGPDTQGVDDGSLLGCYLLQTNGREFVLVNNFGRVDEKATIYQGTIEAHYKMTLGF